MLGGMSKTVALYTCAAWPELWADDHALFPALAAVGLRGEPRVWDAVPAGTAAAPGLIRSTWDYYLNLPAFLDFLAAREAEGAAGPLFNPPAVVRWNLDKRYLLELAALGVPIVPTTLAPRLTEEVLAALWRDYGELVVKPTVSAGSWRTERLPPGTAPAGAVVGHGKGARPGQGIVDPEPEAYLIQPFLPHIADGEWSLVFFDGAFSHAVRKIPQRGDFRVQEQYGGQTVAAATAELPSGLIDQAAAALAALRAVPALSAVSATPPLYARVDGVLDGGRLLLMEIELIEPALYLRLCEGAADRLCQALRRRL